MKTDHSFFRLAAISGLVFCLFFSMIGAVSAEEPLLPPEEGVSEPNGPRFEDPGTLDSPGSGMGPIGQAMGSMGGDPGQRPPSGAKGKRGQFQRQAGKAGKGAAFLQEIMQLRQELFRKVREFRAKLNELRTALKDSKASSKVKDFAEKAWSKAQESRELAMKAKKKGEEARDILQQIKNTEDPEQQKTLLQELKKNAEEVKTLLKHAIERIDQANDFADKALEALGGNKDSAKKETEGIGLMERLGNAWNELTR